MVLKETELDLKHDVLHPAENELYKHIKQKAKDDTLTPGEAVQWVSSMLNWMRNDLGDGMPEWLQNEFNLGVCLIPPMMNFQMEGKQQGEEIPHENIVGNCFPNIPSLSRYSEFTSLCKWLGNITQMHYDVTDQGTTITIKIAPETSKGKKQEIKE